MQSEIGRTVAMLIAAQEAGDTLMTWTLREVLRGQLLARSRQRTQAALLDFIPKNAKRFERACQLVCALVFLGAAFSIAAFGQPSDMRAPLSKSEPYVAQVPHEPREPQPSRVPIGQSELNHEIVPSSESDPGTARAPFSEREPTEARVPKLMCEPKARRVPSVPCEPKTQRAPSSVCEPFSRREPKRASEPTELRVPKPKCEPPPAREPGDSGEPRALRAPSRTGEPMNGRAPAKKSARLFAAARPSPRVGDRAAAFYRFSVLAIAGASVADLASSFGPGVETNPILGRGRFGARQASIKVAGTAALLAIQYRAVRDRHGARRVAAIANFAAAGALCFVAARNYQ